VALPDRPVEGALVARDEGEYLVAVARLLGVGGDVLLQRFDERRAGILAGGGHEGRL
jgi:hypothetical protein